MTAFNRWRHRHGFGVHSPLAFIIATEGVSRQKKYRYYEEEAIEASSLPLSLRRHNMRKCRIRNLLQRLGITDYQYILNPTPRQRKDWMERLRNNGGILFDGKDYVITIQREGLAFYHYSI